jgi:hypothetical protein
MVSSAPYSHHDLLDLSNKCKWLFFTLQLAYGIIIRYSYLLVITQMEQLITVQEYIWNEFKFKNTVESAKNNWNSRYNKFLKCLHQLRGDSGSVFVFNFIWGNTGGDGLQFGDQQCSVAVWNNVHMQNGPENGMLTQMWVRAMRLQVQVWNFGGRCRGGRECENKNRDLGE